MRPTTEQIIKDAEIAALYLRTLVENGVSIYHAVSLTSSYITSLSFGDLNREKPKEPWEGQ